MYDIRLRYLASVFLDSQNITAESENTREILESLDDDRFISVVAFDSVGGENVQRVGFMAPKEGYLFVLGGKRFDFSLRAKIHRESEEDFSSFCKEASNKLSIILKYFGRKGHRLALVREGLIEEMENKTMDFVASSLLSLPPTFSGQPPFEWDWRAVSLIERYFSKLKEPTNTIITIRRISGKLEEIKAGEELDFDRIRVDFDINTSPNNKKERFGDKQVASFFESAEKWHSDLESELTSFLESKGIDLSKKEDVKNDITIKKT